MSATKTNTPTENSFNKLLEIEASLDEIDSQRSIEVAHIVAKYDEKKMPFLQKRDAIIKAELPSFWSIAFRNHPILGTLLEEEDLNVFSYLSAISVERVNNDSKRIVFSFNSNPYFTNDSLVKQVPDDENSPIKSFPINWLPGMNLVDSTNNNQKRRHTATASFFAWFSDEDREVADIIANELYPNAIKYYSGEYNPNEGDEDDLEELDDEEEEDEETEEDEEETEEEEADEDN